MTHIVNEDTKDSTPSDPYLTSSETNSLINSNAETHADTTTLDEPFRVVGINLQVGSSNFSFTSLGSVRSSSKLSDELRS